MSKIFDALKKVQNEVSGKDNAPSPAAGAPGQAASREQQSDLGVPEEFVAEILSMRYSLESKLTRPHKAIAFASSVRGEGTSTVSRLFSQILVRDPVSKVVLVDANLRHPVVHEFFGIEIGPGLTDLVAGKSALRECMRSTAYPRLSVVPAGQSTIVPMQAYGSEAFKRMIAEILATNDYLIFDAPSVLAYPETTVLAKQVDGVVFVVQAVRTKREVVVKAVDAVKKGGGEVLGVVLNRNKHFIPGFIYRRV